MAKRRREDTPARELAGSGNKASIHKSQNWPPLSVVLPASQRQHEESASKVTTITQVAQCCTLGLAELPFSQAFQRKVRDSALFQKGRVRHTSIREGTCVDIHTSRKPKKSSAMLPQPPKLSAKRRNPNPQPKTLSSSDTNH